MLSELNYGRYKALCLISEHLNPPSRELRLDAIIQDVSDEDLKEWEYDSLFDSLITGDYEMGSHWNPSFLSVTCSDGDQEAVEEAISNHLEAAPSQADLDEYKRLKAKLGL